MRFSSSSIRGGKERRRWLNLRALVENSDLSQSRQRKLFIVVPQDTGRSEFAAEGIATTSVCFTPPPGEETFISLPGREGNPSTLPQGGKSDVLDIPSTATPVPRFL